MSYINKTTLPPKGNGDEPENTSYIYIIATIVVFMVVMVALVLIYRTLHKRSGPLWITKFHVQDPYSSMKNDDSSSKDEHTNTGFSNPIMESGTSDCDSQDGSVKVLGYKPLNTDGQPVGKDDSLVQFKFLFPREKLFFGPEIGTGWFGKVYKGEAKRIVAGLRKTKVIIKKLKDDSTSQLRTRFVQEADMLNSLNHKNVLGILGKATEKEPYIVVFECSPMGNLKEFLISHKNDAESIKNKGIPLKMAIDIAAGLEYLHSNRIYYSDLAARNCVVDADLSVKIGHYGISPSLYENDYYKAPSPKEDSVPIRWLDPESVSYIKDCGLTIKPPTASSNVWSYGVTVWEIVEFGRQPYKELTDEEVIQSVIVDQLYQLPEPKETGVLANQLYEVMKWCWVEPSRRPSIPDMLSYLEALKESLSFFEPDEHLKSSSSSKHYAQLFPTQPAATADTPRCNIDDQSTDTKETLPLFGACDSICTGSSEEKRNDIEITKICDDDPVPITVINSTDQERQTIENISPNQPSASEPCEKQGNISRKSDGELSGTPPPVTYIGDPSDGLAEYERRMAEGTQEIINPVTAGNEIVEVKYSGSEPSVVVENCASGYVVLPGELLRRKSSLRRENSQSRGQSVHFPANILDLRVVHRYHKDLEEEDDDYGDEEDEQVLSHNIPNDDIIGEERDSHVTEKQESRPHDLLIASQTSEDNLTTTMNCSAVERPTSPVEKKIRKGQRRKKLNQTHSDEWLFSINQER